MKTLKDGTNVSSRVYYYLLDYKDKNLETFINMFDNVGLRDLDINQFRHFFIMATLRDRNNLNTLF